MCCGSLTPIYKGSPTVRSAYCGAPYKPQYKVRAIVGLARSTHLPCPSLPSPGLASASIVRHLYHPFLQDTLCVIDGLSMVGLETVGLVCQAAPSGSAAAGARR